MGRRIRYNRPKIAPEETLLEFLCTRFPYFTRHEWELHIVAGHLSVVSSTGESTVASASYVMRQKDELHFNPPRELEPDVDEHTFVLHEDESLLVCIKNGNLPVAEGGRYSDNTLVGVLRRRTASGASGEEAAAKGKRKRDGDKDGEEEGSGASLMYYPVHRLDKETSGLVLLAKQAAAARHLSTQFKGQSESLSRSLLQRQSVSSCAQLSSDFFDEILAVEKLVTKSYVAVLAGPAPVDAVFIVCERIGLLSESVVGSAANRSDHEKLKRLKMACFPADAENNPRGCGRAACSRVRILSSDTTIGVSVASVDILTGRTHQIRLHCAQIGFPVLGDKLYEAITPDEKGGCCAVTDDTYLARVRDNRGMVSDAAPRLRVKRHLLHATLLSFSHPDTAERMNFFADPREWILRDVVEEDTEASDAGCAILALQQLLDKAMGVLQGIYAHTFSGLSPMGVVVGGGGNV